MALLARREHSASELLAKLQDDEAAAEVVAELRAAGLQSDERYAEAYLHSRSERGYGPLRIARELRGKGVEDDLVDAALAGCEYDWNARVRRAREKKYGEQPPADYQERMKQSQFLRYRGFTDEQISGLLGSGE